MAATEYADQEQYISPPRTALDGTLQREGSDGIAADDPTKFIDLIVPPDLITNMTYAIDLDIRGFTNQSPRQSQILQRMVIATWIGAGFSAQSAIGVPVLANSGAWSGNASLSTNEDANGIRLRFDSDKAPVNTWWWWRCTIRLMNTTFPLLP